MSVDFDNLLQATITRFPAEMTCLLLGTDPRVDYILSVVGVLVVVTASVAVADEALNKAIKQDRPQNRGQVENRGPGRQW